MAIADEPESLEWKLRKSTHNVITRKWSDRIRTVMGMPAILVSMGAML